MADGIKKIMVYNTLSEAQKYPLHTSAVSAGFPSTAEDYLEEALDLNKHLVKNPPATFFLRVSGDSMTGVGMYSNDILIVDRSITPQHDKIVIVVLEGELAVKRLYKRKGVIRLIAENDAYPDIELGKEQDLLIWGVVTYVLHAV